MAKDSFFPLSVCPFICSLQTSFSHCLILGLHSLYTYGSTSVQCALPCTTSFITVLLVGCHGIFLQTVVFLILPCLLSSAVGQQHTRSNKAPGLSCGLVWRQAGDLENKGTWVTNDSNETKWKLLYVWLEDCRSLGLLVVLFPRTLYLQSHCCRYINTIPPITTTTKMTGHGFKLEPRW